MKHLTLIALMVGLTGVANATGRFNQYPLVGGVAVNNLCDNGSTFKTVAPIEVCTKWENNVQTGDRYQGNDWTCLSKVSKVFAISKQYATSTCNVSQMPKDGSAEYNYPVPCTAKTTVAHTYGNTFQVPVMEDMGEAGLVVVGTSTYTVPACH